MQGRILIFLVVLTVGFAGGPAAAQQQAEEKLRLTLEDIHASDTFSAKGFQGGKWAEEGPVVTFVESDDANGATHLISYNLETDERTQLIDGEDLYAEDVGRLIKIEDYKYATDDTKVLIYTDSEQVWRYNTKGYYYVYDVASRALSPIADRDDGFQMFAKFSPDGRYVGFVRDRDLFAVDLDDMSERRLTFDGSEGSIINGTSDWVYEEEFGLRDGWAWGADSRQIAFVQLDETNTSEFVMADLLGQYPELIRFRYPKAGETNSEIRVGVVDVTSGAHDFFETHTWNTGGDSLEYIPSLGWTPEIDGTSYVWMFRLNRDQNDLDLLYGDPQSMSVETILEEKSDTWLDVETSFGDLAGGTITYLADGEHFVWLSERDGYRHLYLYQNDGTFVRRLTQGDWNVTSFHGVDDDNGVFYFSGTVESPLERHLYRADLSAPAGTNIPPGSNGATTSSGAASAGDARTAIGATASGDARTANAAASSDDATTSSGAVAAGDVRTAYGPAASNGAETSAAERDSPRHGSTSDAPTRITDRPGTHRVDMSRDLRFYIDRFSNVRTPSVVTLHRADGALVKELETNQELRERIDGYDLPYPEFTTVLGADGTPLNAYVIKPRDFDSTATYPMLMYVYGGPGSQTVTNDWGSSRYLWHAYLAENLGILVASVDNRGTGARSKDFKSVTYRQLGVVEAQDQIAAARQFADLDYVDADRIGIWGWSYGGFLTLMSMLTGDGPDTFKLGVSVAPVTDWRQYDTIYTERYMSTPQRNPEGYRAGAPITYADRMSPDQKLLIVHGDLDDNVHLQNAIQMTDALQMAEKQFQMMIYPGRNHGIYGGRTRLHLFTLVTDFIEENL